MKRLDLDRSYVSMIETGKRVPSVAVLEKIAVALDVPLYLLMLLGAGAEKDVPEAEVERLGTALIRAILRPAAEGSPAPTRGFPSAAEPQPMAGLPWAG